MATATPELRDAATTAHTPALLLGHVSVRLGDRLALSDVSCAIEVGAFVGLIGPNGSGKSTLLRAVLGIVPLSGGSIEVEGRSLAEARDSIAYLPQRQQLALDLPLRACDVVMMGRLRHTGLFRPASREDKSAVTAALDRVGLADRRNSPIGEMSFGQQQRVFFARALAQEGHILLLDEPMNGVDPQTQEVFVSLLNDFHAEGKTIVMATHDLNQAMSVCDHLIVLNQRLIVYGPSESSMTEEVLRDAYGVHLHVQHGPAHVDHIVEDLSHHDGEGHHDAPLA